MVCVPLGDSAVLVELGSILSEEIAHRVQMLSTALSADPMPGVYDVVPAFTTVGVHFDPHVVGGANPYAKVEAWIHSAVRRARGTGVNHGREVTIPVCYGGVFGPDLSEIAQRAGLSVEAVMSRHCDTLYSVGAIGFAPGFPYLLGLPDALVTPRRATPRTFVHPGSVAIGGVFTGIYPTSTPGGWNLIGRTALRLFEPERQPPSLLRVGDRVRFRRVSEKGLSSELAS